MRCAPAVSASRTCSPRRVKSADSIEGTSPIMIGISLLYITHTAFAVLPPLPYRVSTSPRPSLVAQSAQDIRLAGNLLQARPVLHLLSLPLLPEREFAVHC